MGVVEPLTRVVPAPPDAVVPLPGAGQAVVRTALLNRLRGAAEGTIATIVAPAGYGKTTLLAQWAERTRRQVLWVDLEPEDDDAEIVESRLGAVAEEPGLLALVDDVHVLRSAAALEALRRLLARRAPGATVALSSRRPPQAGARPSPGPGPPARDRGGRAGAHEP